MVETNLAPRAKELEKISSSDFALPEISSRIKTYFLQIIDSGNSALKAPRIREWLAGIITTAKHTRMTEKGKKITIKGIPTEILQTPEVREFLQQIATQKDLQVVIAPETR